MRSSSLPSSPGNGRLSQEEKEEAAALIDAYGSYLDIYKCLLCAGKLHSKLLVDKLVCVAKYDSQHKEAVKALQKAKVLLFYEPNMLSALLELLPLISSKQYSSNLDFVALLVSAYPDLQPWCVHGASDSEHSQEFYFEYLSSLLHHEDGNDAAKRDEALVKEWCLMLCSPDDADPAVSETYRQSFFHIASRDDQSSLLYHRDLPFLMDISVKMSEFGLTLSLAKEIVSNKRFYHDEQVLPDVLQHLCIITDKAIEGNDGEINTVLLGQVIAFFNVISPCLEEPNCEFNNVAELSKLLGKCYIVNKYNPHYSRSNIDACITTISENAPPVHSLRVFSQWEYTSVGSSSLVSAIHTSLIRGAREGFRNELSGSLLRIQRAREEGRRPIVENGMMRWNTDMEELDGGEEEEAGGFIWNGILDGTLEIDK